MVTPRQFSSYDPKLRELFEAAYEKPVTLQFPTELDARRQRKQLYAFRDAIKFEKKAPKNLKVIALLLSFRLEGMKLIVYRPRHIKLEKKALEEINKQDKENSNG